MSASQQESPEPTAQQDSVQLMNVAISLPDRLNLKDDRSVFEVLSYFSKKIAHGASSDVSAMSTKRSSGGSRHLTLWRGENRNNIATVFVTWKHIL